MFSFEPTKTAYSGNIKLFQTISSGYHLLMFSFEPTKTAYSGNLILNSQKSGIKCKFPRPDLSTHSTSPG
ncbi:MAG: hypothetical protein CO060_00835 [Candidatus Yonathbacteria bacterium CG_4_9_14_0_2_um_filter_43_16]|nr:MAG: hypothetical protein COW60_03390 [Candidatus Yonathbacteria bacterium CG17_big_fil_post_rev_8_21_14_2_50_43_9]PJC22396.1 MAG: hypothetical protein CO060_00835 [Candidatus Yonathbacteria bacterium CG_4_9_14_0_2_um_filter_43_16]